MRKALVSFALTCTAAVAAAAPASVPTLVGMLPAGSTAVVAVDVAALRAQPIVQSWLFEHSAPWSGVDEETSAFLAEAGLDPVRHVDLMLVAIRDGAKEDPLALFGGRFDPSSLAAALIRRGADELKIAGRSAYRLEDQAHTGSGAPFMTVADDLLMVGSQEALTATITGDSNGSALVADSVRLGHLDLNAPFWMVVEVPDQVNNAANRYETDGDDPDMQAVAGLLRATASVRRVVMMARVSDFLEVASTATATSDENAELLGDAVRGVLAAARLQAQERHPALVDVLRKVRVVVDGSTLNVTGSVPVALLQHIVGQEEAQQAHVDR